MFIETGNTKYGTLLLDCLAPGIIIEAYEYYRERGPA